MKKNVLWLFAAILLLLSGCSPTKSGISDNPVPNSQIIIGGSAFAQASSSVQSGKAAYSITCMIQYTDRTKSNSEFNSATVTVNGIALGKYSDGVFINTENMNFSQGDTLEFVIKHPKIGTVKETIQVPLPVPSYSLSPSLPSNNFPNVNTTFLVSWNPVGANAYYVISDCYNAREVFITEDGLSTSSDSMTITVQDSSGNAYPFLQFRLMSINWIPVPGFSTSSGFNIGSSYYKVYSNL